MKCRELLRSHAGGIVINLIRENQALLGLRGGIFDLVFEGFWDLYLLKSKIADVTPKKLQMWCKKIKLVVNNSTGVPSYKKKAVDGEADADDQEIAEAVPPYNQISAIVRILIEKRKPEPVENDEGVL